MGQIVKYTAAGFDGLTEINRERVISFASALLSGYDFQTIYEILTPQDKGRVKDQIKDLLKRQRQEAQGNEHFNNGSN